MEISKLGFFQQMIHSVFPLLFICAVSHITVVELCEILPQSVFISSEGRALISPGRSTGIAQF